MKNAIILIAILMSFTSCSTYQATVKKYDKLQYESIRAYPQWKYKEPKGQRWITPVLCIGGGVAYGYHTETSYNGEVYTGAENAALWGGVGLLAGAMLNGILFNRRGTRSNRFDPSQTQRWLRKYNRSTGSNYVLHRQEPNNSLVLVPQHRHFDLLQYEKTQRELDIAKLKAQEDRLLAEQENRRKRQEMVVLNEEKKRNIVQYMTWHPITVTGEKEIYPSALITATTYAGTQQGQRNIISNLSKFLGFSFRPEVYGAKVQYEIESTDGTFLARSSGTITINGNDKTYPEINWRTSDLLTNKETKALKVVFRLRDEAGNYAEKILDLAVLSINECILALNGQRLYWTLPAYVNEQNPLIDGILKEALDKGYVEAWTGYQLGEKAVFQQVEAVWKVLADRGYRYSSITGASTFSKGKVFSQYVRTVTDAVTNEQVNCIDGTLLFASILRRISIDPYIILYPGHANLAFDVYDKNKKSKFYLELTRLPNPSFEQAIIAGYRHYAKVPMAERTEVDIDLARKSGIKPLGN